MNIYEKLLFIQGRLKAPKSQFNKFGNYKYRNCEDILEALKPLLNEIKAIVYISDDVVMVGERYYVKTTVNFVDTESGEKISSTAYAREEEIKKGMDGSQITGSSSSYARKYALNGMFGIDDTKDSDTPISSEPKPVTEVTRESKRTQEPQLESPTPTKLLSDRQVKRLFAISSKAGYTSERVEKHIQKKYKKRIHELTRVEYDKICTSIQQVIDASEPVKEVG